jgi:flagellar export protein FliJ
MKKFRFKFTVLEQVRKARENETLRILGESQRLFRDANLFKSNLQKQLAEALFMREQVTVHGATPAMIRLQEDFVIGIKQRIIQSDQAILRAKRGVEKSLRAYLAARRQMRMIEVLREKAFEEFKTNARKREQREMDDLNTMRARLKEVAA